MCKDDRRVAAHWLQPRTKRQQRTGCSVAGCDRPHKARGYCRAHYEQLYRLGFATPRPIRRRAAGRLCSVPGCSRPHCKRDYCQLHYNRLVRRGWDTPERRRA